ncbi:MAG TPA: LPS export ABC transporter ATP-binding protein [Fimbriiglobus sp.]|jgi:lipopolysaccharide export system ATP-binding protein
MALLDVHGLVKTYGRRKVVDGVSFQVNPGEVVGLLGPNGAGKTTSFRMTTGQLTPDDGDVRFNEQDVTRLPMFRRARLGMGYLSQEQSIFRKLTVEQNLTAILESLPASRTLGRSLTRAERRQRTEHALEQFRLTHVRKNSAARCSGGEKRRLEIARCLVCEPLLILLDEPFAAVDPKTTADIRHNIRDLAKQGIGILLTDHNVREVLRIADRIYLITEGRVITHGTPQQLVRDPVAIDAYLGKSFEDDGLPGGLFPPPAAPVAVALTLAAPEPAKAVASPAPEPPPPPPFPVSGFRQSVHQILDEEMMRRWLEQLKDRTQMAGAWQGLLTKGRSAVPVLLEALERRDMETRHLAYRLLQTITGETLDYQADAADDVRLRQVAFLRLRLDGRRAG